jgi:RNA polymerase sigma-70 factor (ECF subfamily)
MFVDYAPRVLDYARHRGATLTEAEDVVSEVFVVAIRRLDDIPADVLPWLYGVARKVLANQLRGRRRRLALLQRAQEQAARARFVDLQTSTVGTRDILIRQGLSKLPAKEREALLLVAWDGLTYEEAARALGVTRSAFAQLLRRARLHLFALIADVWTYDVEEGPLNVTEDA